MPLKHVLFVCSQNRLRSPTAEQIFSNRAGFEVASAGTDSAADVPVSAELLEWADVIFVMERAHRNRLAKRFKQHLKSKRIVCLDIPDEFEFMDPALVKLLEAKVGPFFARGAPGNHMGLASGSSLEWVDRETLRYSEDGFTVLVWVDFEPGLLRGGRILKTSSIQEWTTKPEGASGTIDAEQRSRIIGRVQQYYRGNKTKIIVEDS